MCIRDRFERNAFVRLKANANYWGGKPEFDTVTIKFVTDAAARVAEVESGNAHVTLEVPYEEYDRLKATLTGVATPVSDIGMIFLNDIDAVSYTHLGAYTLPGFRHDWAAMNLSLFAGSGFMKLHGAELAQHGLEFAPVSQPFASVFPDGIWCGVSTDHAATTARIASHSAADAETWAQLTTAFGTEAPHLFGLLGSRCV